MCNNRNSRSCRRSCFLDAPKQEVKPANTGKHATLQAACDKHSKDPKMCYAVMNGVFKADSAWCTKGAGAKNLNCGNVRPGSGRYGDPETQWIAKNNWRKYSTLEDGIYDNVAIYAQLYEGKSVEYMRTTWAGGSYNWKATVQQSINQYT